MAAYNVDVKRAKLLVSRQIAQRRERQRICVAIAITHYARLHKHRHVIADVRSLEALCDAAQRRFLFIMRGFVQRAKHFFTKLGKHGNASGDGELITMLVESVFYDQLL